MTTRLQNARDFAEKSFGEDQRDVFEHTLEVVRNLEKTIEVIAVAAMLHDVVEDTEVTIEEVRVAFGRDVADVVAALTRGDDETYEEYLTRVYANPVARIVKLKGDIPHNMSRPRVTGWTDERMAGLRQRYARAARLLAW